MPNKKGKFGFKKLIIVLLLLGVTNSQLIPAKLISAPNPSITGSKPLQLNLTPIKKITSQAQENSQSFTSGLIDKSKQVLTPVNLQTEVLKQIPKANVSSTTSNQLISAINNNESSSQPAYPLFKQNYGKITLYQLAYTIVYNSSKIFSNSTSRTKESTQNSTKNNNSIMDNQEVSNFDNVMTSLALKLSDQLLDDSEKPNKSLSSNVTSNKAISQLSPQSQLKIGVSTTYNKSVDSLKQQINSQFNSFF